MSLKQQLIREYRDDAQLRSNERAAQAKARFEKWIAEEEAKLRRQMEIVFGKEFEYNISYRQNIDAQIGVDWQPFVEIEDLRAVFRHNGLGLSMWPNLYFLRDDLPQDWEKNPQNDHAPEVERVSSRPGVGEVLSKWEKADWEIHDWPANGYRFEDAGPSRSKDRMPKTKKRFCVLPSHELNGLYHSGRKFTIYGTGLSEEWGGEAWFIEMHDVEIGETES